MSKLPMAIWLLGWACWIDVGDYLWFLEHGKPHPYDQGEAIITIAIWLIVAAVLYPRKTTTEGEGR